MRSKSLFATLLCTLVTFSSLSADNCNKVDFGPAFVHVDILQSGNTAAKLDMYGWKTDVSYTFLGGFGIKPSILLAKGKGNMLSGSIAFGHYFPIIKSVTVMPNVGVSYTYLKTKVDQLEIMGFLFEDLKEEFRSTSPFVGLDVIVSCTPRFRLYGMAQYAWSRAHTKVKGFGTSKGNSQGANWGLMAEQDINKNWSANLGVGYNSSLDENKQGIRGYGAKLGTAFWW